NTWIDMLNGLPRAERDALIRDARVAARVFSAVPLGSGGFNEIRNSLEERLLNDLRSPHVQGAIDAALAQLRFAPVSPADMAEIMPGMAASNSLVITNSNSSCESQVSERINNYLDQLIRRYTTRYTDNYVRRLQENPHNVARSQAYQADR